MRAKFFAAGLILFGLTSQLSTANAAVILGPTLNTPDSGYSVTGLEFHASDNSALITFIFQNQGSADTVILTNSAGTILDSISTPSGTPSYTAHINWALTSGNNYWLLQQTANNDMYAVFGSALPSDADISILFSGTFAGSIANAIANTNGFGSNQYWAAFNHIETSTGTSVPEPLTLSIFGAGIAGAVAMRRKKAKKG
jgi:hypothetical protein